MLAVAYCLAISVLYVASLYIWRVPADRQHPDTVKARMVSVLLTCCVAWLPAWHMHQQATKHGQCTATAAGGHSSTPGSSVSADLPGLRSSDGHLQGIPDLLQLLGVHVQGLNLLEAMAKAAALTLLLFLGPLHHKVTPPPVVFEPSMSLFHRARDLVVSPIAEEWCFRACMVPLLWLQGYSWTVLIFLTPLFFGSCHLHHLWGLTQQWGFTTRVVAVCLLQFLYSTVFGWYAVWVLLSTGSVVAAALVHALCNMMGLPPFHCMNRASVLLCVLGVCVFAWAAPKLLSPTPQSSFWWQQCGSTTKVIAYPPPRVTPLS